MVRLALLLLVVACGHDHDKDVSAAHRWLVRLGKDAKVAFITNDTFPKGKATTLPDGDCCKQPDHLCPPAAWESDPVWTALQYRIDEPSVFHYAYESRDGLSFTATATGDPGCDGQLVTYAIEGTSQHGNPSVTTATVR